MIVELKNVPEYDIGTKTICVNFNTIDSFESVDLKTSTSNDCDSDQKFWLIVIELKNTKIAYRADTQEKQIAFYELIKNAIILNKDFFSIDFNDWV